MIIVTGATGTVGRELVGQLKDTGVEFLAMVRDTDKAHRTLGRDVDVIYGDYMKPDTLDVAFREATKVYLVSPSNEHQVVMENNVVDAAVRAGVDHLVKQSVQGASPYADVHFFRFHYLVENRIKETNLPYTFLRPNTFMQNLLGQAQSISSQGKIYGSVGDGKVSMIDARDIASAAATALTTDALTGQTFDITGAEALTFRDAANILSQALGREVQYVDVAPDEMKNNLLAMGLPEWRARDYTEFQEMMGKDYGSVVTPDLERVLGRKPISFDRFARDYAQWFLQARAA